MSAGTDVERKLVSVLFLDLVESTARFEDMDPEDTHEILAAYQTAVGSVIADHGGSVEKFIGDAVVAVFGAPLAHGEDANRAVRAGLAALAAIRALPHGLVARAAVCTGEAVVTPGAVQAGEAIATGDVMSTAARLQAAAAAGGLLVGEQTRQAVRGIVYEDPIEIRAKGKSRPVRAWPVQGLETEPPARPAPVGRDAELAALESAWLAAQAGETRLLTIVGPAGIGKSTLVQAFLERAGAGRARILRGRCLPYGQRRIYSAFAEQIMTAAGIYENDASDTAAARLQEFATALLPADESEELQRYLALLLGLSSGERVSNRVLLFFAARRLYEGLAASRPAVIVFEDLHWATPAERALLEYLAEQLTTTPVLVISTARPGAGAQPGEQLELAPLTDAAAGLLASRFVAPELVPGVISLGAGNPLFIEEFAAALSEGITALPATVQEAVAARIDALPPQPRTVLLAASVFGRVFWAGPLAAVAGALNGALEELEVRDFLRREAESRLRGEVQYVFKHALVREVAYRTLSRRVRGLRHAAAAEALEEHVQDGGFELRRQVGYHWREAGDADRAGAHLLAAAEAAMAGWEKEEAVAIYDEVLEMTGAADAPGRARVRALKGRALVDLTDYGEAARELAAVIDELTGDDELEALLAWARALFWLEETTALEAVSERLLTQARRDGRDEFVAPALSIAGIVRAARGGEGAIEASLEMGRQAFNIWPRGRRQAELAIHEHHHGLEHYWSGNYRDAAEFGSAAYLHGTQHFSLEATFRGGVETAMGLIGQGRHEEGMDVIQTLIDQARLIGRGRYGIMIRLVWGSALVDLCKFQAARELNQEAVDIALALKVDFQQLMAAIDRLLASVAAGDLGGAQSEPRLIREQLERASRAGWHVWLAEGRFKAGLAALQLGTADAATAAEAAAAAVDFNRRMGRPKYELEGRLVLAEALAALDRRQDALREAALAEQIADRLGTPPGRWRSRATRARLLLRSGDDIGAEAAYRQSGDILRAFMAGLRPENAQSLRDSPLAAEILEAAPA